MDGKLPVNPSGGLKAKGHPIGATGVSMHVLSAMQLCRETPEGMQVRDAKIGNHVPKSYRKATKVMARDIELAVIAAA